MFKWNQECLWYSIKMAVIMTCIIRMVSYLVSHNMGYYEPYFTHMAILNTQSVGILIIGSALSYQSIYNRRKTRPPIAIMRFKSTLLDCAFYSIKMTLAITCLMEVIALVTRNNGNGLYELFLSKDALLPTILLLVFGLIAFGINCQYSYAKGHPEDAGSNKNYRQD